MSNNNPKDPTRGQYMNCPVCGAEIPISRPTGRKPLGITVKNVYDSLRNTRSIPDSADELGCSRGYIYGVLKDHGVTLDEVLRGEEKVEAKAR